MSQVYEIYSFDHSPEKGTVYVEAEVEDSVLAYHATQYEPECWTHGRCSTEIIWEEDDGYGPCTEKALLEHLNNHVIDWVLIPFDNL